MKLNIIPTTKIAMLCAAFCAALFAFNPNARALTIGDDTRNRLRQVRHTIRRSRSELDYVNHLIGMGLGTQDDFQGQHFTRSNNDFGPLAPAVLTGHVNGTSTSINLGAGGTYHYLFAKYDGPNYGSEVWYVGDLSWHHYDPGYGWRLWPFRMDTLWHSWRQAFQTAAPQSCCSVRRSVRSAWRDAT